MTRFRMAAVGLAAILCSAAPAAAGGCGYRQPPSPATHVATGISFVNDSNYAFKVYWSDFKGHLREYGLVQPGETTGFKTYLDHQWYIELYTPDEAYCLGPVSAPETEQCTMRINFDDSDGSIGMDGSYCDYR